MIEDSNNKEIYYCLELKMKIPEGEDIGADTNCEYWVVKPELENETTFIQNGGRRANSSGKSSEHIIGCFLEQRGFRVRYRYQLPCQGIWGNDIIVDIFCQGIPRFRNGLILESKWQDSSGSAFQKIPYAIENIKNKYPCETILIIDGEWMRKGVGKNAFEWAKAQIGGKLFAVYTFAEFASWVMKEL
ncbi:PD-(D/E)XK nuclease superfamily protein [Iningainema tapete]|uniref:PD-(D/E)XK nuclease superfamily protein n=1 Tax=Iningainema tapete TaxID=2806730 RepID=UPI001EE229FB|nr:PD-(D/E)XK nuclease superfamily protein [Iningainema tapete]